MYFEQHIIVARAFGDRRGIWKVLNILGSSYIKIGAISRAIGFYRQSLAITRDRKDVMGSAVVSLNLALALTEQGQHGEALRNAEYAAQVFA